jgi:4-amino-4-deoxy-L-arabinose transferase-like glycosyltransferase
MRHSLSAIALKLRRFLFSRHRAVLIVLLVLHAALLIYSASVHSPAIDEPAHLASGLSHWREGDFTLYRVNPPLVRLLATAPLLFSDIKEDWSHYTAGVSDKQEHDVGIDFIRANGSRIFHYMMIARWACIPFSLIGAVVCYAWARMLFGRLAGLAAATLWCFSPTVLGNAALITPDTAGSATGAAACFVFARWIAAPNWRLAIVGGVALGVAESCKSTWVILYLLFPLLWGMWRLTDSGQCPKPRAIQLTTIILVGWLVLGATGGALTC